MVEADTLATAYQTRFRAGANSGLADTLKDGAGGATGLPPHELLEAALAACLAITARIALDELGASATVRTHVSLDRTSSTSTFNYAVELDGLDADQRLAVLERVERSPVRQTLSKALVFRDRG
jgi:putative redox protein